ncbi:hypothetical protein H0H81_004231 [Sphagnurus paluster]|uniref:BTB domain-containing protein n=1 Tax=Sphagnurus paluster TaxID=117069 RepID=A0A9P7FUK6_9AGAR|nr:hypothetical protein H0H81_004231 [Sphagnurus paluster]
MSQNKSKKGLKCQVPGPLPQTSEKYDIEHQIPRYPVNAIDADVKFLSADLVLFHIHRRNLEFHSGAFPPAEISTQGEIVPLTENAATLELLFQFVYAQRYPRLNDIPFGELSLLAEAAEKYEVYAAINICSVRMQ